MVEGANGNTGLKEKLLAIRDLLTSMDKVMVFFDNIADTVSFSSIRFLQQLQKIKETTGAVMYVSNYYCFEEIFLSSIRLLDCINKSILPVQYKDSFRKLNEMINEGNGYEHTILYKEFDIKENLNKEQFCNYVLSNATLKLGAAHTINKGKLGDCWLKNCMDIELPGKEHQCTKCFDVMRNASELDKVLDICRNSVLKNNIDIPAFIRNTCTI